MSRVNRLLLTNGKRAIVTALLLAVFFGVYRNIVSAAQFTQRSIEVGSSQVSATTTHTYGFNTITTGSIGSVVFEYCTNTPYYGGACTAPAGLDVTGGNVVFDAGIAGLSVDAATTVNRLVLSRLPSIINPVAVQIQVGNIVNPSTVNQSVFVRMSTHSSTDGTGAPTDTGAVVFQTTEGVDISGFVPPYLTFCVGAFVSLDCSSISGSLLSFGELSSESTSTVTSQFSGFTNSASGFSVFLNGSTMTSGNFAISAINGNQPSSIGSSQFGVNLRANTVPLVGSDPDGAGSSTVTTNYSSSNSFRFVNGEAITNSPLPTLPNRFTVSYIVNVPQGQNPGVYASTILYTAIATF